MLKQLQNEEKSRRGKLDSVYEKLLDHFEQYMRDKKINVDRKKFKHVKKQELNANYRYLQNRYQAINEAIIHFLGKKELDRIVCCYEEEMTRRILEAREHS